jgi:hypothetical protein
LILDGPVVNQKFETWVKRQNDRYADCIKILDMINDELPLSEIINRQQPASITTHLSVIKHIAKRHGQIITTVTKECDTEIARYASLNQRVIAVLADDTDFLIFPGAWKYFSLRNMDIDSLMTKEYSRDVLRTHLQLTDFQLVIFATLSGNDVIKFEEVEQFHKSLIGPRNSYQHRFTAISRYIQEVLPSDRQQFVLTIASHVFDNTGAKMLNRIEESLEMFNINFEIHEPTDPLLKLCRELHYDFTYSVLMKMRKNFTLTYYDWRVSYPNIHEIKMNQFRKQIGILLKHGSQPSLSFEIAAKVSHQDVYRKHHVEPIYPPQNLPPLIELLQRELFPAHDSLRFELLKWTISDHEKFRAFDLERIPLEYFQDILVLTYLVLNKLIEPIEADIILLSVKHVNINAVPENLQYPEHLNPRAFKIAFLFTKFHSMIHRSLECTGLKKLKVNNYLAEGLKGI